MKNGLYRVEFSAMGNYGTGSVTYRDGHVSGGDAGFGYIGQVTDSGGALAGSIEIFQHTPGYENVFAGLTTFTLTVQGKATNEDLAALSGTTTAAPGVTLQVSMQFLRPL